MADGGVGFGINYKGLGRVLIQTCKIKLLLNFHTLYWISF